jgi:hypothetical protein
LTELAQDLGHRVGGLLRDVIPPDAQLHLLNAQRELLTALIIIYEHQSGARRPPARNGRRRVNGRAQRPRFDRISID